MDGPLSEYVPRDCYPLRPIPLYHLIKRELLEADALRLFPRGLVKEGHHWRLTRLEFDLWGGGSAETEDAESETSTYR